jgi:hypothetical protein
MHKTQSINQSINQFFLQKMKVGGEDVRLPNERRERFWNREVDKK